MSSAPLITELIQAHYGMDRGELLIAGVPVTRLADEFGSPLYLYDAAVFRRKLARLRRALPGFEVFYSVKANPNPAVVRALLDEGCGLEIASAGELQLALACGCPPGQILFAGPGKTEAELEQALAAGVHEIHVESDSEIQRLERLAAHSGRRVNVAVRINPSEVARGGAVVMGGRTSPFGFDEEILPAVVERLAASPVLNLTGIHVYCGSEILDAGVLLTMYQHTLALAESVAALARCELETVDFGGGLGVPYFERDPELDLEQFGQRLAPLLAEARRRPGLARARFVIEPGRYLVAEGGLYVARVVCVKCSRGAHYIVLDGGMNHHLAASGCLGQVLRRNYPLAIANRLDQPPEEVYDVVGPLCTPLDTLARKVRLPRPSEGDLVVIFQSGAYGLTASPTGFLSHPAPQEVMVERGEVHLISQHAAMQNSWPAAPAGILNGADPK